MDTARYVVGTLLVMGLPPGLAWWFVVHPFVDVWRRMGARASLAILTTLLVLGMIPLFFVRDLLLGPDLGTSWPLVGVGAVLMAAAAWIAVKRKRHLTFAILAGVPELQPDGRGGRLLTEGPYGRCRNPRYVEFVLGTVAYAAFANYLGTWILAALTVPAIHAVVLLEERELRARFGEEYEAYLRTVPRYVPTVRPSPPRSPSASGPPPRDRPRP